MSEKWPQAIFPIDQPVELKLLPGRGLLTVACLVLIALVCISVVRTLERERRLLRKLRARGAVDADSAVRLADLSEDERDCAQSLATAGVLCIRQHACYLRSGEIPVFRRKRVRLALSGGLAALVLAVLVAVLILRR
jgi:hypothetical protein